MGETNSLLRLVEEKLRLKRELEENQKKQEEEKKPQVDPTALPNLPEECNFNINVRLPLETLMSSRFVCKEWYGIVNSPLFIDAHLQRSETGLIYLAPARRALPLSDVGKASSSSANKVDFSVESKVSEFHWHLFNPLMLSRIKFLEIKDDKSIIREYNVTCMGQIRASCNGLIILEISMTGGLVFLNPVTRKLNKIPCGTRSPHHIESYGLAFCHESSRYKLVHLFQDTFKYFDCEVMDIGSGSWRGVNGPPNGFFGRIKHNPVFAMGALHWMPDVENNEHIVSMAFNDEKFRKIPLPSLGGIHDRILEICGFLGFVTRQCADQFDVWILRSFDAQDWEKQLSITVDCSREMVPLFYMRVEVKLVFKCVDSNDLYVYDHHLEVRKIEVNEECFSSTFSRFPHVNSLMSWGT
ncbi:hypothetical protein ACS0TY_028021 [Phlomoides rotata]